VAYVQASNQKEFEDMRWWGEADTAVAMLPHSASGKCEGSEIRYGKPWNLLLIKQARAALLAFSSAAASDMHCPTTRRVARSRGRVGFYPKPWRVYPIGCGVEGSRLKNKAELWYTRLLCVSAE
jgi:hypothetical protein